MFDFMKTPWIVAVLALVIGAVATLPSVHLDRSAQAAIAEAKLYSEPLARLGIDSQANACLDALVASGYHRTLAEQALIDQITILTPVSGRDQESLARYFWDFCISVSAPGSPHSGAMT